MNSLSNEQIAELLKSSSGKVGPDPIDPVKRLMSRRLIDETTECWLWTGALNEEGYGLINLHGSKINRGRVTKVHRMAAILWLNLSDDSRIVVRHSCPNRHCFNPEHLLLGSQKQNMEDAALKGRMAKKLSLDDVRRIRALHSEGVSMNKIAYVCNVSPKCIADVIHRRTFANID